MLNINKVKDFMKQIEDLTSRGDYREFEVALLIAERSEINYSDVNADLIEKVEDISNSFSSLFDENLNYELEDIFQEFQETSNDALNQEIEDDEPDICE